MNSPHAAATPLARCTALLSEVDVVALDLDGTLVDSGRDLAEAVNRALETLGTAPLALPRLVTMIGSGFDTLITRALRASLEREPAGREIAQCRDLALVCYEQRIVAHSALYPGVAAALAALRASGVILCCVTNKYARLSRPLLRALDLERWFDCVLCAEHAWQRKPSPALLTELCQLTGTPPARVLMVGDTCDDIAAARAAGCRVAAVTYGYNAPPRLLDAAPDALLDSLEALFLPA